MAEVIFCVLLMLPIWLRISFPTAISHCLFKLDTQRDQQARTMAGPVDLPALSGLEFLQSSFQAGSDVVIEVTFRADLVQKLFLDRKSTRLNSSHVRISYAVFCLKKKTTRHLAASCCRSLPSDVRRTPTPCAAA